MFTKQQLIQEESYSFPYHYLDLESAEHYIHYIEYRSYMNEVSKYLERDKKILDIGCGDGRFCYTYSQNGNLKIDGLDFSEKAIGFARLFSPQCKFFNEDITNFEIKEKYDYIVMIETLEHLNPKLIPKILNKIFTLLVEGGKLVITVPSTKLPLSEKHFQHFDPESLETLISEYFDVIEIKGYSSLNYKMKVFKLYKTLLRLVCPLRHRIKNYYSFLKFVEVFYENNLAVGDKNNSNGLIAFCQKRDE